MSTSVWPPIAAEDLSKELADTQAAELSWLLAELQPALASLSSGLEEISALLAPSDAPSTLALSSHRSESLKGIVVRHGARIISGTIRVRLPSLPPPVRGAPSYDLSLSSAPHAPTLILPQLTRARNAVAAALDVVDVSRWTGDATSAPFMAGQLRLLHEHVRDAKRALKGAGPLTPPSAASSAAGSPHGAATPTAAASRKANRPSSAGRGGGGGAGTRPPAWNVDPPDPATFHPPLPPTLSFHLTVADAALVLELRTLEIIAPAPAADHQPRPTSPSPSTVSVSTSPASPPADPPSVFSLRDRLAAALSSATATAHSISGTLSPLPPRPAPRDEANATYVYRGARVRVRERVRVESSDPGLISAMAKVGAVEHGVGVWRGALAGVMGVEGDSGGEEEDEEEGEEGGVEGGGQA